MVWLFFHHYFRARRNSIASRVLKIVLLPQNKCLSRVLYNHLTDADLWFFFSTLKTYVIFYLLCVNRYSSCHDSYKKSKLLITYKTTLCVGRIWGSQILTPPKLALLAPWFILSPQCSPITVGKFYIDVFRKGNFTMFPNRVFISMRESDTFLWANVSFYLIN